MRIVLDMQGAQTQSRLRGIGRYTLAFARAVVEQSGDHEVHLVLNGLLDDSIDPIKEAFKDPTNKSALINNGILFASSLTQIVRLSFSLKTLPDST